MADRDIHLLEVQLQNEATWRLLDAATHQRDAALRYHGALVVLVPALLPFLSGHRLMVATTVALAFLTFASTWTFLGTLALRAQQFHVGVAERFSRNALAGDDGTWFADLGDVRAIRPLAEQRDPMGLVVSSARLLVLFDAFLLLAGFVLVVASSLDWAVLLAAGAGAAAAGTALVFVRRAVRRSEAELNDLIERRLSRRTSPPRAAPPPS